MKKQLAIIALAALALSSCGNKTQQNGGNQTDTTANNGTDDVHTVSTTPTTKPIVTKDTVIIDIWKAYLRGGWFGIDASPEDLISTYIPMLNVQSPTVASFTMDGEFWETHTIVCYPLKNGDYYALWYLESEDDPDGGPASFQLQPFIYNNGTLTLAENQFPPFDDNYVMQQNKEMMWLEPDVSLSNFTTDGFTLNLGDDEHTKYKWNGEKFVKN
ncbi:MAG: hypothetical protein J6X05_00300 [Bacteroidales bacterium]|nr:hypothetical protein [Bacteroidales bacterium]